MRTTSQIDQLLDNAEAGRGLWIGLLPDTTAIPKAWECITDPHVTLAHFGKRPRAAKFTLALVGAAAELAHAPAVDAYVSGMARFIDRSRDKVEGDPIVLLLEGKELHDLHARIVTSITMLSDYLGIPPYVYGPGWLPHVSLQRQPVDKSISLISERSVRVRFNTITIVCGEARLIMPMAAREIAPA